MPEFAGQMLSCFDSALRTSTCCAVAILGLLALRFNASDSVSLYGKGPFRKNRHAQTEQQNGRINRLRTHKQPRLYKGCKTRTSPDQRRVPGRQRIRGERRLDEKEEHSFHAAGSLDVSCYRNVRSASSTTGSVFRLLPLNDV